MTIPELAIKIVDTKIAITKLTGKGNPGTVDQLRAMKGRKEKTVVEVGMKIQRNQSIDYYMTDLLLKAVINNAEIPAEYRKKVAALSPETLQSILEAPDNKTMESLRELEIEKGA